ELGQDAVGGLQGHLVRLCARLDQTTSLQHEPLLLGTALKRIERLRLCLQKLLLFRDRHLRGALCTTLLVRFHRARSRYALLFLPVSSSDGRLALVLHGRRRLGTGASPLHGRTPGNALGDARLLPTALVLALRRIGLVVLLLLRANNFLADVLVR
ncbi:hypothetical protein PFISCL1PPCAC_25394, partial [Pristionchus fissidentatus]